MDVGFFAAGVCLLLTLLGAAFIFGFRPQMAGVYTDIVEDISEDETFEQWLTREENRIGYKLPGFAARARFDERDAWFPR